MGPDLGKIVAYMNLQLASQISVQALLVPLSYLVLHAPDSLDLPNFISVWFIPPGPSSLLPVYSQT